MIEQKSFIFHQKFTLTVLSLMIIAGKRIIQAYRVPLILCIIDHYLHFLLRLSQSHLALRVMKAKN